MSARAFQHVMELQIAFETTSDWAQYEFEDMQVHVVQRELAIAGGGYARSDGGFLAKASYDTTPVTLRATIRAIMTGPRPRVVLGKGNAGESRFKLSAAGRSLVDVRHVGSTRGDDKNRYFLPLPATRLASLQPAKLRHFERKALAFYYGWYGHPKGPTGRWRHWNAGVSHHDSLNTPTDGWYDSLDPAVIERHCALAKAAGLDGLVLSWWTNAKRNAALLKLLLPAAKRHHLDVSVYVETTSSAKALRAELKGLLAGPAKHPAWLRADGKPVVFLYTRVLGQLKRLQLRSATVGLRAFVVGDTLAVDRFGDFDALHTYYLARKTEAYRQQLHRLRKLARLAQKRLIATVMPGYNDTRVRVPGFVRGRDKTAFLRRCFEAAAGADWLLLTSFNEWHEGTEIEPSIEEGKLYLQTFADLVGRWRAGP